MTTLGRTSPPTVTTPNGTITAKKVILALYAWSLGVRELRPGIMVICTDAAMTEQIPDEIVALGWTNGPGLTDSSTFVEAQRTTDDGRVMWSKAGGALPYGARIDPWSEPHGHALSMNCGTVLGHLSPVWRMRR